jgi:hypothetical protein
LEGFSTELFVFRRQLNIKIAATPAIIITRYRYKIATNISEVIWHRIDKAISPRTAFMMI